MTLKSLIPDWYKEVYEMNKLLEVEEKLFNLAYGHLDQLKANQYILTADLNTLINYEKLLNVERNFDDSIETRRFKALAKYASRTAYSTRYFMGLFSQFYEALTVEIVYDSYEIMINIDESKVTDKERIKYLIETMRISAPANMIIQERIRNPFNQRLYIYAYKSNNYSKVSFN